MPDKCAPFVKVQGASKHYPVRQGLKRTILKAVNDVDLSIYKGETLGLVGESGCGKSTLARMLVGLEELTAGTIRLEGEPLYTGGQKHHHSTKIQMVFQDPFSSLNSRKPIYDILAAPILYHEMVPKQDIEKEVLRLLDLVELPQSSLHRYPHEFSGGQRQRIGIARALSLRPELLICDEPVSALDVSIQAQILDLLSDIQKQQGLTSLFIGHGLAAVRYMSDRIAVMYLGKIVEVAPAEQLFQKPMHPYTQALVDAAPIADPRQRDRQRLVLSGDTSGTAPEVGCPFAPRCPFAEARCKKETPHLNHIAPKRYSACLRAEELYLGKEA